MEKSVIVSANLLRVKSTVAAWIEGADSVLLFLAKSTSELDTDRAFCAVRIVE